MPHIIMGSFGHLQLTVDKCLDLGRFENWVVTVSGLRKDENFQVDCKDNQDNCPDSDRWAVEAIARYSAGGTKVRKLGHCERNEAVKSTSLQLTALTPQVGQISWRIMSDDVDVIVFFAKHLQKSLGARELSLGTLNKIKKRGT